ncbi:MAG: acyltransferase [Candidatus Fimenecus sp.]
MEKRVRKQSLDLLRTLAIFSVLFMHATEQIYSLTAAGISDLSTISQLFVLLGLAVGRLGVPLFLMLTGYLLLPRHYDEQSCVLFWKKSLLPLIAVTIFWNAVFFIFLTAFYQSDFAPFSFLKELLFLKPQGMTHMWYMAVIIGIYLFIPLISMLLEKISVRLLLVPMLLATVCLVCVPSADSFLQMCGKGGIQNQIALDFSGSYFGLYLLIGYLFSKYHYGKRVSVGFLSLGILSVAATVFYTWLQARRGIDFNFWYNFFGVFAAAIGFFGAFVCLPHIPFNKVFYHFSKNAFGIYILHLPLQMLLLKWIPLPPNNPFSVLCMWLLPLLVSDFAVTWISKIPRVGKWLFLTKA